MLRIAGIVLAMASCWRSPPAPPPLRGHDGAQVTAAEPRRTSWRGTCGDATYGWEEEIAVTLTIRDDGRELVATGTLAFAGRHTRARLRGRRLDGARHILTGEMKELEDPYTRWGLILELEARETSLRGRFIEVLDEGGREEMCRFDWSR